MFWILQISSRKCAFQLHPQVGVNRTPQLENLYCPLLCSRLFLTVFLIPIYFLKLIIARNNPLCHIELIISVANIGHHQAKIPKIQIECMVASFYMMCTGVILVLLADVLVCVCSVLRTEFRTLVMCFIPPLLLQFYIFR